MTPDSLKLLFDANAIPVMFITGLLVKYLPFLKVVPNNVIPWLNAIGYVLIRMFVPDAHAADGNAIAGGLGMIFGAFVNAVWARQLFEGFARPALAGLFGKKK